MTKFAVIKTGGKQYKVVPGQILMIEKLGAVPDGEAFSFKEVLLETDGESVQVGTPFLLGKTIPATIVATGRSKKLTIIKFKSKTRYRVKRGHRQPFTKVKIGDF